MLIHGERNLHAAGINLWLAGLTPVALDLVRRSALGKLLGRERMCFDGEFHAQGLYVSMAG